LIEDLIPLAELIAKWREEGLSNDDIRRRMADPSHVGDDMLDRIGQRRERGRDLLGRDPKTPG
jgi:hypothetical protein